MEILQEIKLKRIFLYSLIASISVSALIGIWAILLGNFGWFEARILGTTLTVVGTSILGLACGAYLESPQSRNSALRFIPLLGIILSLLAAFIGLWLIWFSSNTSSEPESIYKILGVSIIFAFSFAHLSLLSLAKLSKKFQWSLTAAYVTILALALILSVLFVLELTGKDSLTLRVIGVLAVVDAALTVMIPVFHRLSRADFPENRDASIEKIDEEIESLQRRIPELERQKQKISDNNV
ncbi:MAG: hypothetical protein M3033_12355 [Acidobacteriota bacterium]|nr:hypothetical protein [Acidobacteriota bacterium]